MINENDYKALLENDDILNNFVTNILIYKAESYAMVKTSLNYRTFDHTKYYEQSIAEQWLRNYFDNYTDKDTETMLAIIRYKFGASHKKLLKP